MNIIDSTIFVFYIIGMLGVGIYFMRKNSTTDDYYVGGRDMGSVHVGLSVVATDVGGGFSIGLGGLGFMMGISGSWMLFTGLIGAWLAAVFLIPKIYVLGKETSLLTFPQIFESLFDSKVAFTAGIISAIGYLGFTSSQILAGAKLAAATFDGLQLEHAVLLMGIVAVVYTVMGGIKAVIYTDTVQWAVLMIGLVFIGVPMSYHAIGGYDGLMASVQPEFLSLTNLRWQDLVNWAITIIPIWFVGMTLYQRIYACRSVKEAKKAWFLAGLFEYPIMAFMGVALGLFSRVALDQGMFAEMGYVEMGSLDAEMGLPLLLKTILPVGLMGIMMSAYFSAIMSTADSCLMASSGNIVTDIMESFKKIDESKHLRVSQVVTLLVGAIAVVIALSMENVLDLMLMSYAFMVSGLLVPVIAALFFKRSNGKAALSAMIGGGLTTLILETSDLPLPFDLDPNLYGILMATVLFIGVETISPKKH